MSNRADPMAADEREAKLPAWVREKMRMLRSRTAEAETYAEKLRSETDPDGSDAVPGLHDLTHGPIGLGKHIRVAFVLGKHDYIEFVKDRDGEGVQVMASDSLRITHSASNTCLIDTRRAGERFKRPEA